MGENRELLLVNQVSIMKLVFFYRGFVQEVERMKKSVIMFLIVMVLVFALLLGSCNFPLFTTSNDEDYQSTIAALQATSSALAGMAVNTPSTPQTEPPVIETTLELPTATLQITHYMSPSAPGVNHESGITDANSSTSAEERRAAAGENFAEGLLERPFNANTMDKYFPYLDITKAWLNHDSTWLYVMIQLVGLDDSGKLSGAYGAEFDLDVDGRGDILVIANRPGIEWSVAGVQVWQDSNKNIGNSVPVGSDPPQRGDGYDRLLFDAGLGNDPDLAWARIDPSNPQVVDIAIKYSALNNDPAYMWGVWAQDLFHPEWFDYNDHFTIAEAGSASTLQADYYPIKALAAVDNTCRWVVGFTPTGKEPGVCYVPATPTPTATNTPLPEPGTIVAVVFYDVNANTIKNAGEIGLPNAVVKLSKGACGSGGGAVTSKTTNSSGIATFNNIPPGKYCLKVTTAPPGGYTAVSGTGPVTVTLDPGGTITGYLPYTIYIY